MSIRLTAAALLLAAAPAFAQTATPLRATPPDSFLYISHDDMMKKLATPEPNRVYSAAIINDHENFYVEFVKRLDNGNMVEQHTHWVDYITILTGEGMLTYGGTVTNANSPTPGEVRGGVQTGASTQLLKAGDYFQIPSGMAHKLEAAKGKEMTYVVVKARL